MSKVFILLLSMVVLSVVALPSAGAQQAYRTLGNSSSLLLNQVKAHNSPAVDVQKRNPQVVFFEEGFESGDFTTNEWELYDADGDGNQWGVSDVYKPHTGSYTAGSSSWISSTGALTPDNWMVTPLIDLSDASGTVLMDYWVRAQDQTWPNEYYGVFISTAGSSPEDLTGENGASLFEETVQKGTDEANNLYVKRTLDLSSYAGEIIFLGFRHFNCTDWFVLDIDDIIVYESSTADLGITGVAAPSNESNCMLTNDEAVTVTLFNFGGAAQSNFDVSYTLNGTTVTETFIDTIKPASPYDFTFTQHADFSLLGYYSINFAVALEGDIDESNNQFVYKVSSTDADILVEVSTDSQGGQSWDLINTNGDTIATHGAYQWNITDTTKICVIADDCYTFKWYGGGADTVSVFYNGNLFNTTNAAGDFTLYSLGDACEPVNALFVSHDIQNYGVVGDATFSGTFRNIGAEAITSFDVKYSVDGIESTTETISGLNIGQGNTYMFSHPTPYNFANTGSYNIVLTISNLNAVYTPVNNTKSQRINILSYKPTTRILGEEATGTWCGWCTRGHVFMEFMEKTYPDTWIGVAVHNEDPMVVSSYDTGIGNYISGYPSGLVNRNNFGGSYDVDPSLFEEAYKMLIDRVVPADVSVENVKYDAASRKLSFDVTASFAGDLSKNFKMNAIIVEYGVTGTSNGFDQANYYSGGASGPMGGYEDLPDPVLARDMVYQNVARAILDGWNGTAGVIDNPTVEGQLYTKTYNYTLPAGVDMKKTHIIGVVSESDSGEIVNSNKVSINTAVKVEDIKSLVNFNVYPNPGKREFTIELNFEQMQQVGIFVTDNVGRKVMVLEQEKELDYYFSTLDLGGFDAGVYYLNVRTEKGISVQKIIKL